MEVLMSPCRTTKYLLGFSLLYNVYFLFSSGRFLPLPSSSSVTKTKPVPSIIIPNNNNNNIIMRNNNNNNNTIYGHLHMSKTGGSEIIGRLANSFERVCGNKGYSYDYYQLNQRAAVKLNQSSKSSNKLGFFSFLFNQSSQSRSSNRVQVKELQDSYTDLGEKLTNRRGQGFNRGKVPPVLMDEIGYENCDYISVERPWRFWKNQLHFATTVELHVPCRDPLEHLMSQCNHHSHTFNCHNDTTSNNNDNNLQDEIQKCIQLFTRFDLQLLNIPNVNLKCFNPIPVDNYLQYMDQYLQKKRQQPQPYIHRDTNNPRIKKDECLWQQSQEFQTKIRDMVLAHNDYYKFCHQCMGSQQELNFLE